MKLLAPFVVIVLTIGLAVYVDDTPADADFVFINRGDVFTLDPQRMSYTQDFRMAYALYEGLVRWDNRDFTIQPALADLPDIAPDRRVYTFRLRSDARWSNGAPVTADDLVYSWRRLILPDTAADYSNLFFVLRGARDFWQWRADQLSGFVADPWSAGDDAVHASCRSMVRRLESLLAATDLPPSVSMVSLSERAAVAKELHTLDRAIEGGGIKKLRDALQQAARLRGWHSRLNGTDSREVEARWMWHRVEERFAAEVGIRAVDAQTLQLMLEQPCAYLLDLLAFSVAYPVYRPCVEGWPENALASAAAAAGGWRDVTPPPLSECRWVKLDPTTGRLEQKHQWARPGTLISNGPYVLEQWRYKRDMRLVRNPMYHTPAMAKCDMIVARSIEDTNTSVLAFESGSIDWLSDVNAEYQADMLEERRRYEDRHRAQLGELLAGGLTIDEALAQLPAPGPGERRDIHVFPTFGTDFYSFNCRPTLADGRRNPLADARVRRAFALAVDKRPIVTNATRLNEPIVTTLIPPNSIPGYRSPAGLPFDVQRARQELADAGWRDRDGDGLIESASGELFPIIDLLWTTNTPRYKWISLELKAQWEQHLGVRVELRGADTKFYKEDLKQGKYMIARGRWYGDYGDPTTFLELNRSTDGNNDRGYKSETVDRMLDEAAAELEPERRMRLLEECERFLVEEDMPILVLCQLVQVYMYDPVRVSGLSRHPRLTQFLWQVETKDRSKQRSRRGGGM